MSLNILQVGAKVHHPERPHPTQKDWLQANGEVVNLIMDDDGEDVSEVVVEFGVDDLEMYSAEQLEWTDDLGGYWRVT